eukprot:s849_g18.t1
MSLGCVSFTVLIACCRACILEALEIAAGALMHSRVGLRMSANLVWLLLVAAGTGGSAARINWAKASEEATPPDLEQSGAASPGEAAFGALDNPPEAARFSALDLLQPIKAEELEHPVTADQIFTALSEERKIRILVDNTEEGSPAKGDLGWGEVLADEDADQDATQLASASVPEPVKPPYKARPTAAKTPSVPKESDSSTASHSWVPTLRPSEPPKSFQAKPAQINKEGAAAKRAEAKPGAEPSEPAKRKAEAAPKVDQPPKAKAKSSRNALPSPPNTKSHRRSLRLLRGRVKDHQHLEGIIGQPQRPLQFRRHLPTLHPKGQS